MHLVQSHAAVSSRSRSRIYTFRAIWRSPSTCLACTTATSTGRIRTSSIRADSRPRIKSTSSFTCRSVSGRASALECASRSSRSSSWWSSYCASTMCWQWRTHPRRWFTPKESFVDRNSASRLYSSQDFSMNDFHLPFTFKKKAQCRNHLLSILLVDLNR